LSRIDLVQDLQARLAALADPSSHAWWERYLEGAAPFRGVRTDQILKAVQEWYAQHDLGGLGVDEELDLALALIRQQMTEDKLAGMLYIQGHILPRNVVRWEAALPAWEGVFADGSLAEKNVCDWFALKVLGPLARGAGEPCARAIADWSQADNVWQQRASIMAFADDARSGEEIFRGFVAMLLEACDRVVQNPDPAAQSAVARVLRELSVAEPARVESFVLRNFSLMSPDAVREATKKRTAGSAH